MSRRPSHHLSPLRYPGGKAKLAANFKALIRANELWDKTYVEPFAGGAGVALALLMHGYVKNIVINDLSPPVCAFWKHAIQSREQFIEKIRMVPLTIAEWENQRDIFRRQDCASFELGFAAFYLNRTNHSGVLNGGVIGGKEQSSRYGIDARFNRDELVDRIDRLQRYRENITVTNEDAGHLLKNLSRFDALDNILLYADPPYVHKGPDLYYDFFKRSDHERLSILISRISREVTWAVSYDDHELVRRLYSRFQSSTYNLSYSVKNGRRLGTEVIFFSENISDVSAFSSDHLYDAA